MPVFLSRVRACLVPVPKKRHAPTWKEITNVVSCVCMCVIKSSNKRMALQGTLMIDLPQGHTPMFSPSTICSLCSAPQSPGCLSFTLWSVDVFQLNHGTTASALGFIQKSTDPVCSLDTVLQFSVCRNRSPQFLNLHLSFHKCKFSNDV